MREFALYVCVSAAVFGIAFCAIVLPGALAFINKYFLAVANWPCFFSVFSVFSFRLLPFSCQNYYVHIAVCV